MTNPHYGKYLIHVQIFLILHWPSIMSATLETWLLISRCWKAVKRNKERGEMNNELTTGPLFRQ